MSKGNVFHEMKNGVPISVGTVAPVAAHQTENGAAIAVGGLAAATTWIPNFFSNFPNGFAPGCLYIDTVNGEPKVNIGTAAAPVWSVIS